MRHEPNVLLLHYSDAVKDLKSTVAKIANFYGVDLSDDELEKVSNKCSMTEMKVPFLCICSACY